MSRSGRRGRSKRQLIQRRTLKWVPRTRVGKLVESEVITDIDDIFHRVLPIKEVEIVDRLLPNLKEEVCDVKLVQKQTDAGEQSKFKVTVVVGTDGYIGVGEAKAKEVGPAIRKAINLAKLHIIPIRRGCGSWECGCGEEHSLPFKVRGKVGSVSIELIPAPKGVGLAVADTAKTVLSIAGIRDVWSRTKGRTRTTANLIKATIEALRQTMKISSMADLEG
ncbi:MAG: 30S ribosomal protein S5 [Promethearchaeota archaeon]